MSTDSRVRGQRQAPTLVRETFRTSRLLDFCSQRELVKQIGHPVDHWALVILKELVDNALDAAEEASTAPTIAIDVAGGEIIIADNGPGISAEMVADILDFTVRVSSREAYVSPSRGAQGNALKTIVAMGFALDGTKGETVIESRGVAQRIIFKVDQVRQEPKIELFREQSLVTNGTRITVHWPVCASSKLDQAKPRFLQMAADYGWLNPHLSLALTWNRKACVDFKASNPAWTKWRPCEPTPPCWYDEPRFRRLMGAYVARDEDRGRRPRTVREFISEFRGLSGSAKQKLVLDEVDAARLSLPEFFGSGDNVNNAGIGALLAAMRKHTRPVKPADLGLIGKDHLADCFHASGAELKTFKYQRLFGDSEDGVADVVETAFGWVPEGKNGRRIVVGVNWSPAIENPFRSLGGYGESLDSILAQQRSGRSEPIIFVLHLARPRIEYTDHGKSAVAVPGAYDGSDDE
jgi:Histidine kinase-, DNA gyrase B-, and HSP90-like ATPase